MQLPEIDTSTILNETVSAVSDLRDSEVTPDPWPENWQEQLRNELISVALALALAFSPFIWADLFIGAYAIPSRSMDETLQVGDLVVAEKLSSVLKFPLERGDIIFFEPPQELEDIVAADGGRLGPRDRFVKRVAAIAGDEVTLGEDGRTVSVNGVPANYRARRSSRRAWWQGLN